VILNKTKNVPPKKRLDTSFKISFRTPFEDAAHKQAKAGEDMAGFEKNKR
jgi:hypothetical protein